MWFWWFILICDCLIPAIMIIAGRMMWKHCPKKINGVVGYQTKMSMINMDTWRFAHDHAGKLWWKVGIGLLGPTMLIHIPFYGASDDIDMMGGSIAVESKKGVGTTFTVEIPLELKEQVIQSEQKQPLHRDLTGVHVLMAEDNDLNAELATIILEDAGMTVTRASDGKEVVDLFKNHPRGTYDFILMDIMMPNMDGHQAAKAIRALGIERSDAVTIPIIALSANAFIDDIQESLDSGMNDHISKPINMEELTDTIAKYIKRDTCLAKELKQKQNDG